MINFIISSLKNLDIIDNVEQINHDCPKPAELVYIVMPTESNLDEIDNLTPSSIAD